MFLLAQAMCRIGIASEVLLAVLAAGLPVGGGWLAGVAVDAPVIAFLL